MTSPASLKPPFEREPAVVQLARRICVRPPYFALQDVAVEVGFSARASAETAPRSECGPMTAAEIGRHGAIAGLSSIAMASDDPRRYYYLATTARCRFFCSPVAFGTPLEFSASPVAVGAREAAASVLVTVGMHRVGALEIRYSKLREEIFARIFAKQHRPARRTGIGYRELPPFRLTGQGEAILESVPEEACAGHFDNYPALPVAVRMGELIRLAGTVIGGEFWVTRADVEAQSLVWAKESAQLRATPLLRDGDYREFDCVATVGDRLAGRMLLGVVAI